MTVLAGVLFALALVGRAQDPQLVVTLDRDELEVGEEAELLLEFTSPSDESAEFDLPPLPPGLQVLGRAERTSVTFAPAVSRTSTLVLTLRAFRVRFGIQTAAVRAPLAAPSLRSAEET